MAEGRFDGGRRQSGSGGDRQPHVARQPRMGQGDPVQIPPLVAQLTDQLHADLDPLAQRRGMALLPLLLGIKVVDQFDVVWRQLSIRTKYEH
jgi:hypothetical protein